MQQRQSISAFYFTHGRYGRHRITVKPTTVHQSYCSLRPAACMQLACLRSLYVSRLPVCLFFRSLTHKAQNIIRYIGTQSARIVTHLQPYEHAEMVLSQLHTSVSTSYISVRWHGRDHDPNERPEGNIGRTVCNTTSCALSTISRAW